MTAPRLNRPLALLALLAAVTVVAALVAARGPAAAGSAQLSERLAANHELMRDAIDAWHGEAGDPPAGQAPVEVMGPALVVQKRVRYLAKRDGLAKATLAELPADVARQYGQFIRAARSLRRLSGGGPPRKLRVGKPRPLAELVDHYEAAEDRYGVAASYLAAINLVETKFGRVKSRSTAGAQGPMQFIPSTWRIYGRGGNVGDPADAIPAAARLLKDHGAPGNYRRALYHYNPSRLYVDAVSRYAKEIAKDRYAMRFLYCWGP
jgi:membrane-bound lytic murein transglycosylase B